MLGDRAVQCHHDRYHYPGRLPAVSEVLQLERIISARMKLPEGHALELSAMRADFYRLKLAFKQVAEAVGAHFGVHPPVRLQTQVRAGHTTYGGISQPVHPCVFLQAVADAVRNGKRRWFRSRGRAKARPYQNQ